MNICWEDHTEIVYECIKCPLCEANRDIAQLRAEIEELETKLENK